MQMDSHKWILLFLTFLVASNCCSTETDSMESPEQEVASSELYTIANGLQVYIIQKDDETNSGASLSVGVGSGSNPKDLPGLAHFVEHALFLGSSKFPEESNVAHFLRSNGGHQNGATDCDETIYSFNVVSSGLAEALERFGDMFTSPLFRESSLEKEIEAVDSEFKIAIQDNERVFEMIDRVTLNKHHPFSTVFWGNRQTLWNFPKSLGRNITAALVEFFQTYYRAGNMRLVVQGPQPLDELRLLVERSFSQIKKGAVNIPFSNESPYGRHEVQRWIFIVPRLDVKEMILSFALPITHEERFTHMEYIETLITQESKGSYLRALRDNFLATRIASYFNRNMNYYTFHIKLELTSKGLKRKENVIRMFYCYTKLMQSKELHEWFWNEQKLLQKISSEYEEKYDDLKDYLETLSSDLLWTATASENWESFRWSDIKFNFSTYNRILGMLNPRKMRVAVISKRFAKIAKQIEKLSGLKYSIAKFKESWIRSWSTNLQCSDLSGILDLPKPNEFIPTKFEIKPFEGDGGIVPSILKDSDFSKIWFLEDSEFSMPKAIISLVILNPQACVNPFSLLLTEMICYHDNLVIDERIYDASISDYYYSVKPTFSGMKLEFSGYDDRLPEVLNKTLTSFLLQNLHPDWVDNEKEYSRTYYEDQKHTKPDARALQFARIILSENKFPDYEMLAVINGASSEQIQRHQKRIFSRARLHWVFYGNLIPSEALEIAQKVEDFWKHTWNAQPIPWYPESSGQVEIPLESSWLYELNTTSNTNSAVVLKYQFAKRRDKRDHAYALLIDQIMSNSFYEQIRTEEKLGYIVKNFVDTDKPAPELTFVIQSHRHPAYLHYRIQTFLRSFSSTLDALTEEEFQTQKTTFQSVLKMNKPKNQWERYDQLLQFDNERKYNASISTLTLRKIRKFFKDCFLEDGVMRKSLLVAVTSFAKTGAGRTLNDLDKRLLADLKSSIQKIHDISEWKRRKNVYLNE